MTSTGSSLAARNSATMPPAGVVSGDLDLAAGKIAPRLLADMSDSDLTSSVLLFHLRHEGFRLTFREAKWCFDREAAQDRAHARHDGLGSGQRHFNECCTRKQGAPQHDVVGQESRLVSRDDDRKACIRRFGDLGRANRACAPLGRSSSFS